MGGSVRKFIRPKAYYDIERRALKQIEKEKPAPAPKHSTITDLDDAYANPDPSLTQKNERLHSRMKDMYLESYEPALEVKSKSKRPLPENRLHVESSFDEHGYHIPQRISHGKVNFLQMMELLRKYSDSKGQYSPADIAKDYKVDPVKIRNVVNYFQVLQIHLPKMETKQNVKSTTGELNSKSDRMRLTDAKDKFT
ncbi:NADH dehydrogenase [ubiquinone] 1 alpha subcomplex assembly factor 4-like [Ostrea edulis]|uniref:NADH dehydrogenase [ubiquinone] 1 alpha subcomplex assembly factor 4-like n=1 Tax=Ostrea edulis TaxID=37623 RepID=UPI0024AFB103|nr:NADH dehydrogenase [ubiquinone] 1 alpha subcomplex assembly factor 4-like [Ostrea edulis]